MHRYLWLGLAAVSLLLVGCRGDVEADRAKAEAMCRDWISQGVEKNMSQCMATTMQSYATLNRRSITIGGGDGGGSAYSPPSDPAPLPNIISPTVRCQSVPAGLGTVQTVCR
jgi:hypothetical protein